MKREFLEGLNLEKDVIDKIMAENGSDINATKTKLEAERDNYKSQLDTATEALKGFEGVDVKDLQGKVTKLTADLSAKESEYQSKITDMEFISKLDGAITKSGAKNTKAVKALLDIDALKLSKNQDADLTSALENCKKDNGYMFGSDEPFSNPIAPTTGGGTPDPLADMRTAMGLTTETK